ncbi:helix-turn-helix domain-containing protein [Streptomyces sp. NPDC019224]|uniref:ArsR/SmtB family transcription factor n=1 Tax=Streptomyces sp. NPDC019224 TaxID=3154484 RepID=UPI0033E7ED68
MLRIHFTAADLVRIRMTPAPDPLWEVCLSLHRLRAGQRRRTYAPWYRTARVRLHEEGLASRVRNLLLPLVPRSGYFPDFLTPAESAEGLEAGLRGIIAAAPDRVLEETRRLTVGGGPSWAARLGGREDRAHLVRTLRAYHDTVIAPHSEEIHALFEAERSIRARTLLDGGIDRLLRTPGGAQWKPPVLHLGYPVDRDLHLDGRGLRLIPSYFCWGSPVTLLDPELEPVLVYPLKHGEPQPTHGGQGPGEPLAALLGRTRAAVLRAAASRTGATTGELARFTGISDSSASQHATALRNAGLLVSHRHSASVLHTLTPLGSSLLTAGRPAGRVRGPIGAAVG